LDDAMRQVRIEMQKALSEEVFPGAVLSVWQKDLLKFHQAYGYSNLFTHEEMTPDTIFDLASLTKPLSTSLAVLKLIESGQISLNQTLGDFFPELKSSSKSSVTIEMLLRHTSGYPAHKNYFEKLLKIPLAKRKTKLKSFLCREKLVNPIGEKTLYSDLGFMFLAEIIELIVEEGLDTWLTKNVYTPLGLKQLFFIRHFESLCPGKYAATEWCSVRRMMVCGQVHDDNAHALGGVCGHAGLFGTAENVCRLLVSLLSAYHGKANSLCFPSHLVRQFLKRPNNSMRPLGFDIPTQGNSSSGIFFSKESVGHLGFTGTSFWMDLPKEIIIVLLTNRVHPYRSNEKIKVFRPRIHDTVMRALAAA
jgi:CubicO group peptidase (beta-lactamase class C family)